MIDLTGQEIQEGDWVAYATRSWGMHDLKIARVKEISKSPRPHDRWFVSGAVIENMDSLGRYYTAGISPNMMVVIPESRVPEYLVKFFRGRSSE